MKQDSFMNAGPASQWKDTSYKVEDYLLISDGVKYWIGRPCDILMLIADGNYTEVVTNAAKFIIRKHLYECEAKLPPAIFFRTSRSCVVNLGHVIQMRMYDLKRYSFTISNGREIIMSRKQSIEFRRSRSL